MYYHGGYPPNYPAPQQQVAPPQPRPPQPQPINEQSLKVRVCVCTRLLTVLYTAGCRYASPLTAHVPLPSLIHLALPPLTVHVPLPLPPQQLKEMFPQMDEEVFRSVLEANGGNVELSINQLLTMS